MLDLPHLKQQARRFLPAGQALSEIIPLANDPLPIVVFFYFPETPASPLLGDPTGLFSLSAETGERIGETLFRPEDWEIACPRARQARKSELSLLDPPAYAELRDVFEHALSLLIPIFFRGVQSLGSAANRELAGVLLDRWEDATQQGFMDQYRAVGWDCFTWLESVRAG